MTILLRQPPINIKQSNNMNDKTENADFMQAGGFTSIVRQYCTLKNNLYFCAANSDI
jgi:hypothetical protein